MGHLGKDVNEDELVPKLIRGLALVLGFEDELAALIQPGHPGLPLDA
jgi:hypothetical protein